MTETHPEKRLIGYARVSTYGQTLDSQLEQLRKAGCTSRNIYREKATGARPDRRGLNRMLGKLAPGDVVTVTRIDRLWITGTVYSTSHGSCLFYVSRQLRWSRGVRLHSRFWAGFAGCQRQADCGRRGTAHQLRDHRIERDVPRRRQQTRLVHHHRAEATLEQMVRPSEPMLIAAV